MTKLSAFLGLPLAGVVVAACPTDLTGTWKSDQAASIEYARANSKLDPRTEGFLAAIFGHMTLSFGERELHVEMPEIEVPSSGFGKSFAGSEERKPYTILFCDRFSVVWKAKQPFGDEPMVTTFNFVDSDTFWVYGGGANPALPDLHTREFFRRVR